MTESYNIIKIYRKVGIGQITIPKDIALLVCLSILIYVYFVGFFTYNFGMPVTVYYITDVLLLICLLISLSRFLKAILYKRLNLFSLLVVVLLMICTGSAVLNGFNPLLWIWSLRNWGRFFVYFYLCVALLDEKWTDRMLKMTVNVFHVNLFVIALQYIMFRGRSQDALNGLVGRDTSGANIMLIMATTIIVSSEYVLNKCKVMKLLLVYIEIMIMAVLSELKAILLFSLAIFAFILLINSKLTKKQITRFLSILFVGIVVAVIGLRLLAKVYPQFADIISIRGFIGAITTEGGYGNTGYIDRLTAIKVVNRDLLKSGFLQHLFGIGMGNAEYSTSATFTSIFYNTYGPLYRYLNFCVAILYIEGGYIGFGLYVVLFAVVIRSCWKRINKLKVKQGIQTKCFYESVGMGMACLGLIFIWYNNLLRTDMSVLMAFYMAIPFALDRRRKNVVKF